MDAAPETPSGAEPAEAGRPQLAGVDDSLRLDDVGLELRRRLAVVIAAQDYDGVRRLLEPLIQEMADDEWTVEVMDRGVTGCNVEKKKVFIVIGGYARNQVPAEVAALDLEITLVHELGHILYADAGLTPDVLVDFARAARSGIHPQQLDQDLLWLFSIFGDMRLRARMQADYPKLKEIVTSDAELDLRRVATVTQFHAGDRSVADALSVEAFSSLPAREQMGVLIPAAAENPVYEQRWLPAAAPEAVHCLELLRPYLKDVQFGSGQEYIRWLSHCYGVLSYVDLVPEALPLNYARSAAGVSNAAFFAQTLSKAGRVVTQPLPVPMSEEEFAEMQVQCMSVYLASLSEAVGTEAEIGTAGIGAAPELE
jgi:hypothetical protein